MRWRWRIAAVFATLATALAVILAWPDGPRWAVPLDPVGPRPPGDATFAFDARHPCNRPLGFSPDGGTVFAVDRLAPAARPAAVRAWHVATGSLLADIALPPSVRADTVLRLTPDGQRLLVWNVGTETAPGERFVLDLAGGLTVCRIAAGEWNAAPVAFLAGGRLFWTEEPSGPLFFSRRVELFDATTGERVAAFGRGAGEGHRGRNLYAVAFAADGTVAALLWEVANLAARTDDTVVEVVTLPAGAAVRRETLPASPTRRWGIGRHVVGGRFALLAYDSAGPGAAHKPWQSPFAAHLKQRTVAVDGPPTAGADEPYDLTDSGPGWALVTPYPAALVTWAARRLPTGRQSLWLGDRVAGRWETDRGVVACEVPNPVPSLTGMDPPAAISPDGRWLAVVTAGGALELWDIAPRMRWPWAAAAGVIAGGVVALVCRKRFRRATP